MHYLTGLGGLEQRDQLGDVVRERICRGMTSPQRTRGDLIGARRAAESEIDAAGEERFKCAELFGDDERRMIWQHDAARADANRRRVCGDVTDYNCRRRARDSGYSVMLGYPEPMVAESLGVARKVDRISEGLRGRSALNDRREIENREGNFGQGIVSGLRHYEE